MKKIIPFVITIIFVCFSVLNGFASPGNKINKNTPTEVAFAAPVVVTIVGNGEVKSLTSINPAIDCPSTNCSGTAQGFVTLEATADTGNHLLRWEGIVNSTDPIITEDLYDGGALTAVFANITPSANNILYVNKTASGNASGDSWANAIPELADALKWANLNQDSNWATTPLQIFIAKGTYNPMYSPEDGNFGNPAGRDNTFLMVKNVQVYGGFAGTEATLADRDLSIAGNETILSGDVNGNDVISGSGSTLSITSNGENNYHVVVSAGAVETALLDGFTITGGNAYEYLSNLNINEKYVSGVMGGGMHNISSSPILTNVTLSGNTAHEGGGMYNDSSSPILTNVTLNRNSGYSGGGMHNNSSSPTLINVILSGNSAGYAGGGIYNNISSSPSLTNTTLSGNTAINYGGGIYSVNSSATSLVNSIVWDNTATIAGNGIYNNSSTAVISYSLVQDFTDTGNDNLDGTDVNNAPQFTDVLNGDYSLLATSPVINFGSNTAYTNAGGDLQNDVDLAGNPRLSQSIIDMGAYEFQGDPVSPIQYVKVGGTGNGTSWANATGDLQAAIDGNGVAQVWVAKGTYQPAANSAFTMKNDVAIYGGFDDTGNPDMGDRDWRTNLTILSGNGSSVIVNIFTVGSPLLPSSILDGFTVSNGNHNTYGGGIHNFYASPTLSNLIVSNNTTSRYGGGIYNENATPVLNNIIINGNSANYGGGIYNESASSVITNVRISGNKASIGGGGISSYGSSPVLTNVTISGNRAVAGPNGGIRNNNSNPIIRNTVIYGNSAGISNMGSSAPDIANSLIQGLTAETNGNISGVNNPMFTDAPLFNTAPFTNGDYSLQATSPVINLGSNTDYTNTGGDLQTDLDLAGNPRVYDEANGGIIDMGGYEFQGEPIILIQPDANNILYVNKIATGNGSGDSWANALTELADALKWANLNQDPSWATSPLQIFIAKGTYKPLYSPEDGNFGNDDGRNNSFLMVKNVQLYGGFDPGNGITDLTHTRILPSSGGAVGGTILSGDVDGDDVIAGSGNTLSITNNEENNYHVVVSVGAVETALLDGFTVTGGNANYTLTFAFGIIVNGKDVFKTRGGGMFNDSSSPILTNVALSGNSAEEGGGMYNANSSSPSLTNITLSGNSATNAGGGMLNSSSSPILTNVTLNGNSATYNGGGMYNHYSSSPILMNMTLSGNSASNSGGGMFNDSSSPILTNVTLSGNSATNSGGGIYNDNSSLSMTNTILWGNTATTDDGVDNYGSSTLSITYSLVQGVDNSTNNGLDGTAVNNAPQFTDAPNGDYSLLGTSPAINLGSNAAYTNAGGDLQNDLDLAGNPRVYDYANGGIIDMGAYEFQGEPVLPRTDYVWEDNVWTPTDPSGIATANDNILVVNGIGSLTLNTDINNITINMDATLEIERVLTIAGNITNNGDLVFLSDDEKNGELAAVPATSIITGNATVQRYMSANRSYRMVSSAVTTTTSINANWQEGGHNTSTDYSQNQDPNPGFGTHITGSQTGANGFDATQTGNASLFTVNMASQQFQAVGNTAGSLTAGEGYLMFIRGNRSINLNENEAVPTETVLRAKGQLAVGDQSQTFTSPSDGAFAMFGNPYQSAVDIDAVLGSSTNVNTNQYYVYDPTLGDNGAYVTVVLSDGSNTSGSTANQFLQPGQGGQVATLATGTTSVNFHESDKIPGEFTSTNATGNTLAADGLLVGQLYTQENYNNGASVHDSFGILFAEGNNNGLTPEDAVKPYNFRENLGINHDGTYLSLERRALPEGGENFPLFTSGYAHTEYVLKMELNGLDDVAIYLDDHFNGTSTLLEQGIIAYSFSIDSTDLESKASDRFAIRVGERLNVDDYGSVSGITFYPNPMDDKVTLTNPNNLQLKSATIYDITGRLITIVDLSGMTSEMTIDVSKLASATYMITITGEDGQVSKMMIKE